MSIERFYVEREDDGHPEILASAHDFLHALSWASEQMVRRSDADALNILVGDEDGPHEMMASLKTIDTADNSEAFAADAELVLTFESTKVVPRLYQPFIGDIMIVPGNFKGDVPLDEYQVYVDVSHESDLTVNPRKGRGAFTAKGERMYKHIVATQLLSAKRKQVDAKRVAAATVRGAAARGVPGLVRKNPEAKPRLFRAQKVVAKLERDAAPSFAKRGAIVNDPASLVRDTLQEYLGERAHESFVVLYMNVRNQLIGYTEFTMGSNSGVEVHPSGIMQAALACNAAGIITVHNHPTGDPQPSEADRALWRRLDSAGELVGVPVVDHLVVGERGRYYSRSEHV